jgi:hypothetical protein
MDGMAFLGWRRLKLEFKPKKRKAAPIRVASIDKSIV